ncbi:MAG: DNA mismatch repair endonuclease MutL [Holosporales bacterium]|jgi:DNA mismatch repair protein MutL|nr:DNA mismatch repair endonuclease MutL [Holosporales bacterium]
MNIRILPPEIVNQIAAGEVIERPASVIKELVENSMDAGCQSIDVFVRNGGISYICIKDDGEGMSREDLELCIQRHATSKLSGKNLLDIHSFGFRGEALPSICSIARVKFLTKQENDTVGWTLKVDGGQVTVPSPEQCDKGTTISITDLFYTTPARLKFLKSVTTESSYSMQAVKNLALANPEIAFSFTNNTKKNFTYPKADDLSKRITDVLGKDFFQNGGMFEHETDGMHLKGWLGLPTCKNNGQTYCFVNGRPVKDRFLIMAIKTAYQDVIIPGEQPPFVLYLTLDPQEVDINVHPAKTEVRFRQQSKIRGFVINSIIDKLSKLSVKTSSDVAEKFFHFAHIKEPGRPAWEGYKNEEKVLNAQEIWEHSKNDNILNFERKNEKNDAFAFQNENVVRILEYENKEDDMLSSIPVQQPECLDLGISKAQLFLSYIISQNNDCIFIIDQHAVHERIVYEKIEKNIYIDENGLIISNLPIQKLLLPECLQIKNSELIKEYLPHIERIGFKIEIEQDTLKILEVPQILCESNAFGILMAFIDELTNNEIGDSFLKKIHKIFADYACHNSIRANHELSFEEMDALLRKIEQTERIGQCNHGRPSYVKLPKQRLDQLFGR